MIARSLSLSLAALLACTGAHGAEATSTREGFARFGVTGIDVTGGRWRPAIGGDAALFPTLAVDQIVPD